MFPLFELSKLMSFGIDAKDRSENSPHLSVTAWKEVGEKSFLALMFSNGFLLLRYSVHGCKPIVKQIPWFPNQQVLAMCFDPTGQWLLCITGQDVLYIVPALAFVDRSASLNHTWRIDDVTRIKSIRKKGIPTCLCWWRTFEGENIAVIGSKEDTSEEEDFEHLSLGFIQFLNLTTGKIVANTDVNEPIIGIDLVQDDSQSLTYALITTRSSCQWKLLLEIRTYDPAWSERPDVSDFGFQELDYKQLPVHNITKQTEQNAGDFLPLKFHQFPPSVLLVPQHAKGRQFITAHDLCYALFKIYDTTLAHSPLFIYKMPDISEHVILTDKLLLFTSTLEVTGQKVQRLSVVANQMAEAIIEDSRSETTTQDFNSEALVQQFDLEADESIITVLKRTYPFYWHEKRQQDIKRPSYSVLEQSGSETSSVESFDMYSDAPSTQYKIASHTVLDGCIVVTNRNVYECRPRISPEELFLRIALDQGQCAQAENLAIILGLDINALYLQVAEYQLNIGNTCQAAQFFQRAKCPTSKRVAIFAKYGQIREVLVYVQQTLNNKTQELSTSEKKELSDLALHCFIQQLLQTKMNSATVDNFRDFLKTNSHFDEKTALEMMAEYHLTEFIPDFAKSRGLISEALETLFQGNDCIVGISFGRTLIKQGQMMHLSKFLTGWLLNHLDAGDLIPITRQKPHLTTQLMTVLHKHLPDMDETQLYKMTKLFDPSGPAFYGMLSKLRQRSMYSRSVSIISDMSTATSNDEPLTPDETDQKEVMIHDLVNLFVECVIRLNHLRNDESQRCPWYQLDEEFITISQGSAAKHAPCVLSAQPTPLSAGPEHTAIVCEGDVFTCGTTKSGRLGHGEPEEENEWLPLHIELLHQVKVMSVSCGNAHTLALTDIGIYGWGDSTYGQVGAGDTGNYMRPVFIEALAGIPCVQVVCGIFHSMALSRKGRVYTWGWGVHGQLGHGNSDNQYAPKILQSVDALKVIKVAAGYAHSLVLTQQGTVYGFGNSAFGQLGHGSTKKSNVPNRVPQLPETVTDIISKYFHNLALTRDNRVYTWGRNPQMLRSSAQFQRRFRKGSKPTEVTYHLVPSVVNTGSVESHISQIACGNNFSALLTHDGEVYTWGKNFEGQLGLGNRLEQVDPSMVMPINDKKIVHITCGSEHVIAMDSESEFWVWGQNTYGQLGTTVPSSQRSQNKSHSMVTPVRMEAAPRTAAQMSAFSAQNAFDEASWRFQMPDLQGDPPHYPLSCLQTLFHHLWRFVQPDQTLTTCEALKETRAAVWVCLQQQHHAEALHLHLNMATAHLQLQHSNANMPPSDTAEHPQHDEGMNVNSKKDSVDQTVTADVSVNGDDAKAKNGIVTKDINSDTKETRTLMKNSSQPTTNSGPRIQQVPSSGEHVNNGLSECTVTREPFDLDLFVDRLIVIAEFYLRKIIADNTDCRIRAVTIQYFLSEICTFWSQHDLPTAKLEVFLSRHLATLACDIYLLLRRNGCKESLSTKNASSTGSKDGPEPQSCAFPLKLWNKFSPDFHLSIILHVIKEIKEGSKTSQSVISAHEESLQDISLLPPTENAVSADKLWQDILQNFKKDLGARSYVTLSTNEVESLHLAAQKSNMDNSAKDIDDVLVPNVVLFTCGHHFARDTFNRTILSRFDQKLLSAKLPQTYSLLSHYYQNKGSHPLACPDCVAQAVLAI